VKLFLNLVYGLLMAIGSPWIIARIVVLGKNRTGWSEKLFGFVPRRSSETACIWIHAVSVGEINLLPKLVDSLKEQHPTLPVAISSTTETGWKLAQEKFPHEHVFFCPADFTWAIRNTLNRISPRMLVLTELEIWPNLIALAVARKIPVLLINGRISESSYRGYRRLRYLICPILKKVHHFCVQTNEYRTRFLELGVAAEKISVTGNIKFDNAVSVRENDPMDATVRQIASFAAKDFVFVAGSTLAMEDLMLLEIFAELKQQYSQLRLVLVPRHPGRVKRLENEIRRYGLSYALRSQLNLATVRPPDQTLLVVDVIGELASWWQLANAGFVGGTMGTRGGQNMIEPAAAGVPIALGPDTANFKDAVRLLRDAEAARVVTDSSELRSFIRWTIDSYPDAAAMGSRARAAVQTQQGAREMTVAKILSLFNAQSLSDDKLDSRSAA